MTNGKLTKSEKQHPIKKTNIYNEFVLWTAMPPMEQARLGIESQQDFCEFYKIDKNTPTRWKNRPDFQDRVRALLKMWGFDKTPGVIQGIYRSAVKGNSDSQRLWLQYFEGFSEKTIVENQVKIVFGIGDIRNIIEKLPENLKQEHYGNLRKLLDDAVNYRESASIDLSDWSERPELPVSREADYDAQDVQEPEANELATGYKTGVCADLERKIPKSYHQSAARWWEE